MNSSGVGLGLTICKRICELMGGAINVTSSRDKGSTFSFSILLDDWKKVSTWTFEDSEDDNVDAYAANKNNNNNLADAANSVEKAMKDYEHVRHVNLTEVLDGSILGDGGNNPFVQSGR